MSRHFTADIGRQKKLFLTRLILVSIIPFNIVLTLLIVLITGYNTVQPVKYYQTISLLFLIAALLLLLIAAIGGTIMKRHLRSHSLYSFIEIHDNKLLISRGASGYTQFGKHHDFQKLWIISLDQLDDIYYYNGNIILQGNIRFFAAQADWLKIRRTSDGCHFANWWYDAHGHQSRDSLVFKDIFKNGEHIVDIIQAASDNTKKREEQRKFYKEKLLAMAALRRAERIRR